MFYLLQCREEYIFAAVSKRKDYSIMKRVFMCAAAALLSMSLSAQTMKMVIDAKGNIVGRLVEVQPTRYVVGVQDVYDVPRKGNHIEVFSAKAGQGVVYRRTDREGNINVRERANIRSKVVAKIVETDGVPDVFPCLGKTGNWYKIRINGRVGYVREDMVDWDGMSSF